MYTSMRDAVYNCAQTFSNITDQLDQQAVGNRSRRLLPLIVQGQRPRLGLTGAAVQVLLKLAKRLSIPSTGYDTASSKYIMERTVIRL